MALLVKLGVGNLFEICFLLLTGLYAVSRAVVFLLQ